MEALIILIALGGSAVAAYFDDLATAIRQLGAGGPEEMARVERELALAEVVALALVADGEITEEERHTLGRALASGSYEIAAADALARISALARVSATEESLRARLELLAGRLDAKRRADAFALVCALARGGSLLRLPDAGYRGNAHGSAEALVELFATALAIPTEERGALAARHAEP
jgi:uncharacterized tellurite resistance protein B-like protein